MLGILALAVRAYPAVLACILVALVHGWAVRDLWLGAAPVPPGGVPLRVATANVLNRNPTPEKVLDFVRGSGADLVVLVDARGERWRPVLAAVGELYPYRAPEDWREGGQVLLFSREPVLAAAVVPPGPAPRPLPGGQARDRDRGAAGGGRAPDLALADRGGRHPGAEPRAGPDRGRGRRGGRAGDRGGGLQHLALVAALPRPAGRHGLRDAARGQGWVGTWPAWFWPALVPIDHVLVKGPVAVADLRRGPFVGSDHYPLVADLRLYGGGAGGRGSAAP